MGNTVRSSTAFSFADAVAIAGGAYHSLALSADVTVWAWGENEAGQLGDGTTNNSDIPVPVLNLTNIIAIAGGGWHSLALKSDRTVWTWGYNEYGQLGNNTIDNSSIPVQVHNLTNVKAIAAGLYHSLALRTDGTVWAWGDNYYGQLGDGTTNHSAVPVQVLNLTNIVAISCGGIHSMALKSDGTVWAWGDNEVGQLGDGTTNNSTIPVQMLSTDIAAIAGGGFHSLVLKSDGTVWACGNNGFGQLGDGTNDDSSTPVQVINLGNIKAVAAGLVSSLAFSGGGTPWAWGDNYNGILGDETISNSSIPLPVPDLEKVLETPGGALPSLPASILGSCNECSEKVNDPTCRLNFGLVTPYGPNNPIPDCLCYDVCVQNVSMIAFAEVHRNISYLPIGQCRLGPNINLPQLVPDQTARLYVTCASEVLGPDCASVINTIALLVICVSTTGTAVAVPCTLSITCNDFYDFPSCAKFYPSEVQRKMKEIDGSCLIIQLKATVNSTGDVILIDGKIIDKLWKHENLWLTGLKPYGLTDDQRNSGYSSITVKSIFQNNNHSLEPCN